MRDWSCCEPNGQCGRGLGCPAGPAAKNTVCLAEKSRESSFGGSRLDLPKKNNRIFCWAVAQKMFSVGLVVFFVIFLSACNAVWQPKPIGAAFEAPIGKRAMQITWVAAKDPAQECKSRSDALKRYWYTPFLGCAIWSEADAKCVIVTPTKTDHETLGHELRHCFMGQFHD